MSHHLLPMLASAVLQQTAPPTADPTDGLLVGAQGVGFLLTLIGIIVSVALTIKGQQAYIGRLKRDRERIIAEAAAREQQIVAEAAAREDQFRTYLGAIDAVTHQKATDHLTRSRPAENPPPGIVPTIRDLVSYEVAAEDPFIFPVGWKQAHNRPPNAIGYSLWPASEYFSGHIAISGETRYGKGNLAFLILATLCLRLTTAQLQVLAIDPKRDFALWRGLAHNWREPVLGRDPATIQAAMAALRAERERREVLRERC
ncbi:hypothetical protein K2Z83_27685, partial [Oscillochloris sp. ZM17-4]|uniref:hypothetical protein n=1 Tax=Oscillochloris sp. ZM17-4 TaxID=2866714 RepID=UPI001C73D8B0